MPWKWAGRAFQVGLKLGSWEVPGKAGKIPKKSNPVKF